MVQTIEIRHDGAAAKEVIGQDQGKLPGAGSGRWGGR